LVLGALREGVAWFDTEVRLAVEMRPRPRVVVGAGTSPHRHLGDDLILRAGIDAVRERVPNAEIILLADDPSDATRRFGEPSVYGAAPIVHHLAPIDDVDEGLRRVDQLVGDARRLRSGEPLDHPHHGALLHVLAETDLLV